VVGIVGKSIKTAKLASEEALTNACSPFWSWSNFWLFSGHRFVSGFGKKRSPAKTLERINRPHGVQGVEGSNPFTPTKNKK